MAPREPKVTPRLQRNMAKKVTSKKSNSLATSSGIKKTMSQRKIEEQTPSKGTSMAVPRRRTNTEPTQNTVRTPKCKENKPANCTGSVSKSAIKAWKRRPKPAHSGVPVPEDMKKVMQQKLQDSDCSF